MLMKIRARVKEGRGKERRSKEIRNRTNDRAKGTERTEEITIL